MKRILVTGANGQLGTTLKQQSLGSEDQWVFCGRNEIDITDSHSITSFLEKQSLISVSIVQPIPMLKVQKQKLMQLTP